jgi:glutamine---fructose-6-phosphate transaminase (isomerizing)
VNPGPLTGTMQMIQRQGEVLEEIARVDVSGAAAKLAAAQRVLLVGTGTSFHACELGAMMFAAAGLDARAVQAMQWCRWRSGARDRDALIVITHTAETAYAALARTCALEQGTPMLSITGVGRGWAEALETPTKESSETHTVSYSAAVALLARLAGELGWGPGSPESVTRVAAAVRLVLENADAYQLPIPARCLAIAGCGPWSVTAREGALKVREAARVLAEGYDIEYLLHGSAVPLTDADALVVLQPGADPDGLTEAVRAAAASEGVATATFEVESDGLDPLLAQIPMTVPLQLLAERWARLRGQNPDAVIGGAWADDHLWEV